MLTVTRKLVSYRPQTSTLISVRMNIDFTNTQNLRSRLSFHWFKIFENVICIPTDCNESEHANGNDLILLESVRMKKCNEVTLGAVIEISVFNYTVIFNLIVFTRLLRMLVYCDQYPSLMLWESNLIPDIAFICNSLESSFLSIYIDHVI